MNYNNIIMDIGNSRIKVFVENEFFDFDYSLDYLAKIEDLVKKYVSNYRIIYSSVNYKVELELQKLMHLNGMPAINIKEMLSLQDIINISEVKGAGSDRLLGLIGAWEEKINSFTTIDFGSATTINFVQNNKFIGGSIMPGGITMLKSLGNISKKLEFDKLMNWDNINEKDTRSAVNSGIYLATIGAVERALDVAESYDEDMAKSVILTGGLSTIFYVKLNKKYNFSIRPNLVIEGIQKLVRKYL